MTTDLSASLALIEESLRRLELPAITMLDAGVAPETVRPLLAERGLAPPDDLLALWAWRNGTKLHPGATLGEMWFVPGFYLLSAEEAIADFDAFVDDPRWSASWLPVLGDGGGDFMAVSCSGRERHGAVYHFRIDEAEHPMEFESIGRMLATFAAAFDRGIFYVDAEGYVEHDSAALAALAAELNPSVDWWSGDR